jgi:hypothetical protein
MNNELEGIQEEAIAMEFEILEGLRKTRKTPARIPSLQNEVRTRDVPDTRQKCQWYYKQKY